MSQNENIISVSVHPQLFQAIGNYLVTRPYAEVAELIRAMEQSEPVYAPEPPNVTDPSQGDPSDK